MSLSPSLRFSRDEWAALRADTPLTLTDQDLDRIRGLVERISLREVEEVYLPLSRLLNLYVAAVQGLYRATTTFLGHREHKVPF
ncbi:MAG: type I pantothenate kinase, partial [Burkholderiales bacterium]